MSSNTDETMQSELVQCGILGMTSMRAAPMGKRGDSDTRYAEVVRDISTLMLPPCLLRTSHLQMSHQVRHVNAVNI